MRAKLCLPSLILILGLFAFGAERAWACGCIPILRFTFRIDPKTAEKDLLPTPPKTVGKSRLWLVGDLSQVPEIALQEPLVGDAETRKLNLESTSDPRVEKLIEKIFESKHETMASTAHTIAKINHLNRKRDDHFIEVLQANRPDLRALPFVIGPACRLEYSQARKFNGAVQKVRSCGLQP